MALFGRVAIVGLGLIGGSLGMALRRRRLAREVIGWSRRASTLRAARVRGAIDVGATDLRRAVEGAELVVLASPVDVIVPLARRAAAFMPAGSVLTDVGSVKETIVRALDERLPRGVAFVGAHPLAGSERRGIGAARADLFEGSICLVTATRRTNRRALTRVRKLWRALAGRVLVMDPARHDRLLAQVSHLPHLIAFCLVGAAEQEALAIAPRSFLDATRVAKSDPQLWESIFLGNRPRLVAAMRRFDRQWHVLRTRLEWTDHRAIRQLLVRAKARRDGLGA